EFAHEYQRRHRDRRERWETDRRTGGHEARQGFETVFMRANGERFPVLIFEAPLRDAAGEQTGWMSAVLDMSEQRRMEELSRQQQERLQATARLATVGEMASLLSHELNQPLAAIASYATASLNLLEREAADPATPGLVRQAIERVAAQAERAGRVIKSVNDFVRRREHARELVGVDELFEAVLPLVRLQARKSGTRVESEIVGPESTQGRPQVDSPSSGGGDGVPSPGGRLFVRCDRTMVEQVLLNLSRNGIQAMETSTPLAERVLRLGARAVEGRRVEISVQDAGPGVPPEVAAQLFTPFFTTRAEGMGLGLSLCRSVAEQHGGTLEFENGPGARFRFTLPTEERLQAR
ncbi:MAG TPA: ATP-binding protein, partial [Burkholderiaceae bacterium]